MFPLLHYNPTIAGSAFGPWTPLPSLCRLKCKQSLAPPVVTVSVSMFKSKTIVVLYVIKTVMPTVLPLNSAFPFQGRLQWIISLHLTLSITSSFLTLTSSLFSLNNCMAAPTSASLYWYIHHLNMFKPLQSNLLSPKRLTWAVPLMKSFVILSILITLNRMHQSSAFCLQYHCLRAIQHGWSFHLCW